MCCVVPLFRSIVCGHWTTRTWSMPWKASSARWHRHIVTSSRRYGCQNSGMMISTGKRSNGRQEKSAASGAAKEAAQASEEVKCAQKVCAGSQKCCSYIMVLLPVVILYTFNLYILIIVYQRIRGASCISMRFLLQDVRRLKMCESSLE